MSPVDACAEGKNRQKMESRNNTDCALTFTSQNVVLFIIDRDSWSVEQAGRNPIQRIPARFSPLVPKHPTTFPFLREPFPALSQPIPSHPINSNKIEHKPTPVSPNIYSSSQPPPPSHPIDAHVLRPLREDRFLILREPYTRHIRDVSPSLACARSKNHYL